MRRETKKNTRRRTKRIIELYISLSHMVSVMIYDQVRTIGSNLLDVCYKSGSEKITK